MSAIIQPQIDGAVVARAAKEIVELAQRHLVRPDGTIALPPDRVPQALRAVQHRLAEIAGTPEGEALATRFGVAMSDALVASTPTGLDLVGPKLGKIDAMNGGAAAGSTARLALRQAPQGELSKVDGRTIRTLRDDEGVRYFEIKKDGTEQALAYNPFKKTESFGAQLVRALFHPKTNRAQRQAFKAYKKRVNEIIAKVTDEDLMWSFKRLPALKLQEGILRKDGSPFVNQWPDGPLAAKCQSSDFDDATVSRESLLFMLKKAMDTELPAISYSFASAAPLHDYFHNIAHFMGSTLSERVIASALDGGAGGRALEAIWMKEEERHGHVLDAVYTAIRQDDEPVLHAQMAFPIVREVSAKGAKEMMYRRQFAEFAAGSAYLFLKANAKPDSNTDKALDGIFRDEIYHMVLMQAGCKAAYNPSRLRNVIMMAHNAANAKDQTAVDEVQYKTPEPLMYLEFGYAFMAMEKRVNKFMKRFSLEELRQAVGVVYPTEKALAKAVEKGEHARTRHYTLEQNPDLSVAEVSHLAKRFPETFDLSRRAIKESEVLAILDGYRQARLADPGYWQSRKRYAEVVSAEGKKDLVGTPVFLAKQDGAKLVLERQLADGATLRLSFDAPRGQPKVTLDNGAFIAFEGDMADMSWREIGAVMGAESAAQLARDLDGAANDLEKKDRKAWIAEVVKNLGPRAAYKKEPLQVVRDVTA